MIQAIVRSVRCELSNAVSDTINVDKSVSGLRRNKRAYADFLYGWGAEVLLTLTIVEKSAISPSAVGMPPSPADAVFTIAGGLTLSSQATRIEKMNFFYRVVDLYHEDGQTCDATHEQRNDSLLVQNDLKIATILDAKITAAALGNAETPAPGLGAKPLKNSERPYKGEKNVLQHQVTFQVVSSGNLTPAWKLVRATVNPVAPFLSASRDRTHDLIVTFGPLDPLRGDKALVPIAEQTHFSSQITAGIVNGFTSRNFLQ
ncbi:hypothetical protein [Methylobacterium mesophilicum]|nr:hypothetical protein [Methylobacterium mesophilicum]